MAEWRAIKRGDSIPLDRAIKGGSTKSDGDVYVGRNSKGEVGKINLADGKIWNIWCHHEGSSEQGEILLLNCDADSTAAPSWVKVKKGDDLPAQVFLAGHTSTDGDVYACRKTGGGAVGKLNVSDGKVNECWFHGEGAGTECEVLCFPPSAWMSIRRGDDIPPNAVLSGITAADGQVYVGRNKKTEVGKLNVNNGKMHNIWCHDGGDTQEGEILVVAYGAPQTWKRVSQGDSLPSGDHRALYGGHTSSDGDIYICRNRDGAVGKLNLNGSKVNKFWYHGEYFPKTSGEVLCVGSVSATSTPADGKGAGKGGGGYAPGAKAKPAPAPPLPPPSEAPPAEVDLSHWNDEAMCDGVKARERLEWLKANQGKSEAEAKKIVMGEFADTFSDSWIPNATCDGVSAQERAHWLVHNEGLSTTAARERVKKEFPNVFGDWWKPDETCDGVLAKDRAKWLMENKGLSEQAARQQIRTEFPYAFGLGSDGPVIEGRFPHTMSVVNTADGPKLKITVTPRNPHEVSLVAVHYQIEGGASMNFDINSPQPGTHTYVHTTPAGGGYPKCPRGCKVSYWLCVKVNGLLQEQPTGALPHNRRLEWIAP